MKIRILGSASRQRLHAMPLSSYLVNDDVAVDGGALGLHATAAVAWGPAHVFLTHPHLDHIATLPLYLEYRADWGLSPVHVHAAPETLEILRRHVWNGAVWPDFTAGGECAAWAEMHALAPEAGVTVDGLHVIPVPVNHGVPAYGFVVDDGRAAVAFGADSGPTDRLWEVAGASGRLRAAFVECSLPEALGDLAARSGHLTPSGLAREVEKLPPGVRVIAVHIKPRHRRRVAAEIAALRLPGVEIGVTDLDYEI